MDSIFKRKKVLWAVAGGVCVLGVLCAVFYGFNRTEDSERIQAKGGTEENADAQGENFDRTDVRGEESGILEGGTEAADSAKELSAQDKKALFKGKTLSVLGDSISTYEGWIPAGYVDFFPMNGEVSDVDDTWWKRLIDDTGMEFCANSSSAGSTCVGDSLSTDNPKYACSNYRIDELIGKGGVYPDIIIVYMGTNDLLTSVPLGENDGTQTVDEGVIETFSDAYSMILDKLESQYPGAVIFCCTLTQIGDWGVVHPFETFVNGLGLSAEDYSRQIEIIASNRGFGVIDLINCGITADNMQKYVTDGVHLNPQGMEMVCDVVENALITAAY